MEDTSHDLKSRTSIWSNATVISRSIDIIAGWNNHISKEPNIAISENGTLHVVWEDDTDGKWGTDTEIMYASYTMSKGWSNATVISDNSSNWNNGDSEEASIAVDNSGNVHVAWRDKTNGTWGTDDEIMYINYTLGEWSDVTVISDDYTSWNTGISYNPCLTTDNNNNLHIVWTDGTDGEWGSDLEIMYANYTASKGWSNATIISDDYTSWNTGTSMSASISTDNNSNIHVVWEDSTPGPWGSDIEIMYVNYTSVTGWSNATVISDNTLDWNTGWSIYPSLITDLFGNIHVVWEDDTDGEWGTDAEIMYVNYTATGWSNATVISDDETGWNNDDSEIPSIAINNDGSLHVVWYDWTDGEWGTDIEIMYTNYTSATGWNNGTLISDIYGWNNGESFYSKIAIDNNSVIHVVWQDNTNGEWGTDAEIMYVNYSAAIWSNATVISDKIGHIGWLNNEDSSFSSIAVDNEGNLHVVWQDDTNGKWGNDIEILYANYTSDKGWSRAFLISDDSYQWNDGNSSHPSIAIDISGNIHVVWEDETDGEWGIDTEIMYVNYSQAQGWSNATIISDIYGWNNDESIMPSIATDGIGNIHVTWQDSTNSPLEWGTDDEIMYANYTSSMGWSNATVISDDNNMWNIGLSEQPRITIDGNDNIHVVWSDYTVGSWGNDAEIMYVNRTSTGWSNATVISDDETLWNDGNSYAPDIAISENGDIHVVWWDTTVGEWGSDSEIMYTKNTTSGWSNASVISDDETNWNDQSSIFPRIDTDNKSKVHVVWYDYTVGEWGNDLEIMYTSNYFSSWANATVISDDNTNWNNDGSYYPCIAIDKNMSVHVAWHDLTDGEWGNDIEIMYAVRYYDALNPNITSVTRDPLNPGNLDSVNITAHITDNMGVTHVLIDSNHTGIPTNYSMDLLSGDNRDGYWNYSIPANSTGTTVFYWIWANDTFNNSVIDGPYQYTIRDNENPNITSVIQNPSSPTQLDTINITANVTENVGVDVVLINSNHSGVSANYSMNLISGDIQDGSWNYTIPAYPVGTTITYTIIANDTDNNIMTEGPYQYVILDGEDPVVVSVSRDPLNPGNLDTVNITTRVTDNIRVASVRLISNYTGSDIAYFMGFLSGDTQDGYWNYTIPARSAGTTIKYSISVNDSYGNFVNDVDYFYFILDNEDPNIISVIQDPSSPTQLETINITARVTDNLEVDTVLINSNHSGTPNNYSMELLSGDNQDGYWNYTIPAYPVGTTITYTIIVNDTDNNIMTEGPYQYVILDGEDPVVVSISRDPFNPGNLDTVNITARVTDNIGVAYVWLVSNYTGFNIGYLMDLLSGDYQDGYWNFTHPARPAGDTIRYSITVNDTYGNLLLDVSYYYFITDNEDPDIIVVSREPNQPDSQDSINITVHISDNIGTNTVLIFSNHSGTMTNYSMTFLSGSVQDGYWNFTIPQLPTGTVLNYSIWVNDTSSNNVSSIYYQVTIREVSEGEDNFLSLLTLMMQGGNEIIDFLLSPLGFGIISAIAGVLIIGIVVFKRRSKSRGGTVDSRPSTQLPWIDSP